jgi:3'-phosphoadenosine 5'-phosphosulfate sulfotransferase (PAPS reductase)/FAD synthetase|tara:strand:- start:20 stop:868 length:849 start_codon:yes stop_codon:yes gene_type:complete
MSNPYKIEGPAVISFSGGRSSGFMLHKIIEAHGGTLPDDVKVIFTNTGLEHHETYEFIHRIEENWCDITWLEYTTKTNEISVGEPDKNQTWKKVNYKIASRKGEPFRQLVFQNTTGTGHPFLPNPAMRLCTSYLKIRTQIKYLKSIGWIEWNKAIGLRADEQRRVGKIKSQVKNESVLTPMAEAGHGNEDVKSFWKSHSLDLNLPLDSNIFGNCVGCFLKGYGKLEAIAREEPHQLDWWIDVEKETKHVFVRDRPDYETIKRDAHLQQAFDFGDTIDCFCTD